MAERRWTLQRYPRAIAANGAIAVMLCLHGCGRAQSPSATGGGGGPPPSPAPGTPTADKYGSGGPAEQPDDAASAKDDSPLMPLAKTGLSNPGVEAIAVPGMAMQAIEDAGGKFEATGVGPSASVRAIDLSDTDATDEVLKRIRMLNETTSLVLRSTKISDAGLEHAAALAKLESLSLEGTQITDTGLTHLEKLESLTQLNLRNTAVTDAGVARLQEKLPNLKIER